jgi:type II secretory pathway component GspD/PulD (secretin)
VIGERVGYKVTTTINQVTTESIQFLETGVILKVVPSVDQRGRVLLAIHPEVSSASVSAGIPSKKSTEVTTQLLCEDGQSVFVGGLIKRTSSKRRTGVPVLGEIPGVGNLFSASEEIGSNTETVVIITPRVVKRPSDLPAAPEPAAMAPDLAR